MVTPEALEEIHQCLYYKQQGFPRKEIALASGLSYERVRTRLGQVKAAIINGLLPYDLCQSDYPISINREEVIDNERDNMQKLAENKEARETSKSEIFEDRLAKAVAIHLPSAADLGELDRLHKQFLKDRPKGKGELEAAMATISDAHFGLVNPHFTVDTARLALRNYLRKVIRLTELHRMQCPVETIYVNLLGDNIQGSGSNFPNQRWSTIMSVVDQCEVFTEVAVEFIEDLLVEFDNVVVTCRYGNHGYLAPKKENSEPDHANYETLIHRSLAWAFRNNSRVKFNIGLEWYQVVPVFDQKFLMTHGHVLRGNVDGIVAAIRKWQDILEPFDHVVIGHFHRLTRAPLPRRYGSHAARTLYMNGTTVQGDDFIEQFGASHTNEYWLKFVAPGRVTAEYAVSLYD